jgi:hypothetical protein
MALRDEPKCKCGRDRDTPHAYCSRCRENYRKLRKYGITQDLFEQMKEAQDGRCACCGKKAKRLIVDHNHETGSVRGLLCYRCNMGLGHYERDRKLYKRYLREFPR